MAGFLSFPHSHLSSLENCEINDVPDGTIRPLKLIPTLSCLPIVMHLDQ